MKLYQGAIYAGIFLGCWPGTIEAQEAKPPGLKDWLQRHQVSIRRAFDGSRNEQRPAGMLLRADHLSGNDFINVDLAVRMTLWETRPWKGSALLVYPRAEWHRSTDDADRKNRLEGGLNWELFPVASRGPSLPPGPGNPGWKVAPWLQGHHAYRRNFLTASNEARLAAQVSLVSSYKGMPGFTFRDAQARFRGRYYPYLGVEYHLQPNLITKGVTESYYLGFARLFGEWWPAADALQLTADAALRRILTEQTSLRRDVPMLTLGANFYPGKQTHFSVGLEYRDGYDADSRYQRVQITSLRINVMY